MNFPGDLSAISASSHANRSQRFKRYVGSEVVDLVLNDLSRDSVFFDENPARVLPVFHRKGKEN